MRSCISVRVCCMFLLLATLCFLLCSCSFSIEDAMKELKAYINGEEVASPPADFVESRSSELYTYDVYRTYVVLTGYLGESASVTVPSELDQLPVRKIGGLAFYEGTAIEELILPDSVQELEENALYYCTELKSVTLPESLTVIGDKAFSWCGALEEVTLPSKITSIPAYCFNQCTSLKTLTLKGKVTSVGARAFSGCEALEELPFLSEVQKIGDFAFRGCIGMSPLTLSGSCSVGHHAFAECASDFTVITSKGSACWDSCIKSEVPVQTPDGERPPEPGQTETSDGETDAEASAPNA